MKAVLLRQYHISRQTAVNELERLKRFYVRLVPSRCCSIRGLSLMHVRESTSRPQERLLQNDQVALLTLQTIYGCHTYNQDYDDVIVDWLGRFSPKAGCRRGEASHEDLFYSHRRPPL